MFADPAPLGGPKPPDWAVRGPEHAENYRVKVGRYGDRWYRDPLPADDWWEADDEEAAYPSVSTIKKANATDWSYVALKRVAAERDLDRIALLNGYERYERLKLVSKSGLDAASRRGSNIHNYAECLAYGMTPTLTAGDEGSEYFKTVERMFAELQPELVAAEFVAINRKLNGVGYGGTADGLFLIDGKLYNVDWKSRSADGEHAAYPEEGAQVAGYMGADYIIVADDNPDNPHGARRASVPTVEGCLIISIKPDSYEVFPVDMQKATEYWHALHAWWVGSRDSRKAIGKPWPPRRVAVVPEPAAPAVASVASVDEAPAPSLADLAHQARKEALLNRYDALAKIDQIKFDARIKQERKGDLDAVERIIDELVADRMEKDERAAARAAVAAIPDGAAADAHMAELRAVEADAEAAVEAEGAE